MAIWTAEIKELEKLHESLKGRLPDLEKELEQLIRFDDPNVILLYSRRCLEVIITDLCECELKRDRGTEPLKGLIDKLHKERKVAANIITSMHGLNELSTYGTHPKNFDPEQVKPVLNNLAIIIRWYLKYKQILTIDKTEDDEEKIWLRKKPLEEVTIKDRPGVQEKPAKAGKRKLISIVTIVAILIIAAILAYPKIFKQDTLEKLRSSGERISVAVMPFQNMTNDTIWDVWQIAIQTNLIYRLTSLDEIKVRQTETVNSLLQSKGFTNYASITPSFASTISRKLDADVFIYGSINEAGDKVRINAALLNSKTKEALKSFQIDGKSDKIIDIIDSVSMMVKNSLLISQLYKKYSPGYNTNITNSPDAFRYFIRGQVAFRKNDFTAAIDWYQQALKIDSNLIQAISGTSRAYFNLSLFGKPVLAQGKAWCLKYNRKVRMMTPADKIYADWLYACYFQTPYDRIKYMDQLKEIDDQNPATYFNLGDAYLELFQYNDAIVEFKRAFEIYDKWGEKAMIMYYQELGQAYRLAGRYKEEKKLYRNAKKYYPDAPDLLEQYAYMALSLGDTSEANRDIKKWTSIRKGQSWSDADIMSGLTWIYKMAGMPDKEEVFFRQALSLEPENPAKMISLAYFLIDKDRNINEGIELADKVLKTIPDAINTLHTKGWALYKQGKYMEALDLLQKSWDLRMKNSIYNHTAYLHLEAAKKAVANQKNN